MKSSRLEVRLAKNMQRKLMHLVEIRIYLISFDIEHVDITDGYTLDGLALVQMSETGNLTDSALWR